jgi:UDP-N-acetylglucosamine acyltransferase
MLGMDPPRGVRRYDSMMPTVHPTATIDGDVRLADDVVIGPLCVLAGSIEIGPGTRVLGHSFLQGPLRLGGRNTVYPFACLGFSPQDLKWDPNEPGAGLVIGDGNVFREGVSIHRATSRERPTTIGDRNYFMANSHAGHDCRVGSRCTFANAAAIGGHVEIADGVTLGGVATVHQFCRVGRGAMFSGLAGVSLDVLPHFMVTGINLTGSINLVGLRRGGASRADIDTVRWVYRTICRRGMSVKHALDALRERAGDPLVAEYVAFIESSKRGICTARGQSVRGQREPAVISTAADVS